MMPITMMKDGETGVIKKVGGKEETRKFLENLGFVVGGTVTVVSDIGGNLIVNVKDSRVAIGRDMACRIMISCANRHERKRVRGSLPTSRAYMLAISIYIGGLL